MSIPSIREGCSWSRCQHLHEAQEQAQPWPGDWELETQMSISN